MKYLIKTTVKPLPSLGKWTIIYQIDNHTTLQSHDHYNETANELVPSTKLLVMLVKYVIVVILHKQLVLSTSKLKIQAESTELHLVSKFDALV